MEFLPTCFGGCGKAPILTVLRSVRPGGSGPAGESIAGMFDVELLWPLIDGRCGNAEDETARLPDVGEDIPEGGEGREAGVMLETLEMRDLATGSDGRGPVGGAIEGREGRGSVVVVMVSVSCGELGEGRGARRNGEG